MQGGKPASLAASPVCVPFVCFRFRTVSPNENLWPLPSYSQRVLSGAGFVCQGRVRSESTWERWDLEQTLTRKRGVCSAGSPTGRLCHHHKGRSPMSTAAGGDTEKTHLVPLGPLLPIFGKGEDTRCSPGTVESWRSTDTLVRTQGH